MKDLSEIRRSWIDHVHRMGRMVRRDVVHASPVQLRNALEMASRLNPGPWEGEFQEWGVPNCEGIEVIWKGHCRGTVVWVHGGAFAFGSPRVYRAAAVHLAKHTKCRVLMPAYRLAPEHTYPAAHDDVCRALEAIFAEYGDVVVVGDSAGANLVLSAMARLEESDSCETVRGVALLSPWCDLRPTARSIVQNAVAHSPFDSEDSMEYSQSYLGGHSPEDPRVSPILNGDFRRLPPVYLEWAEDEFLAPDIVLLRDELERNAVDLTVRTEPEAVHGWQTMPDLLPEAKRSSVALGEWARKQLDLP